MKIKILTLLMLLLGTATVSAQDKIVVGGSGSLTDEVNDAAKAYMAKNPNDNVEVRQESMSTTGGIEGVNYRPFNHRPHLARAQRRRKRQTRQSRYSALHGRCSDP